MPKHKKNTLLKNAQGNAEGNFFKRVFFSPTQKFPPPLKKRNLFLPTHGITAYTSSCASYVNHFVESVCRKDTTHLRTDRRATDNSTLAIGGVSYPLDSFVVTESSVLRTNFCAEKPAHRQSAKRFGAEKFKF
jgi:hypothetical protein